MCAEGTIKARNKHMEKSLQVLSSLLLFLLSKFSCLTFLCCSVIRGPNELNNYGDKSGSKEQAFVMDTCSTYITTTSCADLVSAASISESNVNPAK